MNMRKFIEELRTIEADEVDADLLSKIINSLHSQHVHLETQGRRLNRLKKAYTELNRAHLISNLTIKDQTRTIEDQSSTIFNLSQVFNEVKE